MLTLDFKAFSGILSPSNISGEARKDIKIMATLRQRTNGVWEIQFRDIHGRRRTITLSSRKYRERTARQLQNAVKVLINKKINNDPTQDRVTKAWVEATTPEIREKLAKFDLWNPPVQYTLEMLWDRFIHQKADKSKGTQKAYNSVKRRFFGYFVPNDSIESVSRDVILEWKNHLFETDNYSEATVKGTLVHTKAAFAWAKEQEWITKNPLDKVETGSYRNEANDRIITLEEYGKLLDACPTQEWRTIITLARIGGLRPCEIANLRWTNIDWVRGCFQVFSQKLKGRKNHKREVPLFPEIVVELSKLRSILALQTDSPPEYIITRITDRSNTNLAYAIIPIIARAGIGPIPRPFDNMRMSRSNEIYSEHGVKEESLWIGHSTKTAKTHYWVTTDEEFQRASGEMITNPVDNPADDSAAEIMHDNQD